MISYHRVSPSFLYILREVLLTLAHHPDFKEEKDSLISTINNVLYINSSEELILDTINWGISFSLLQEIDNVLVVTKKAVDNYVQLDEQDFYHSVLMDYMVNEKPFWLAFFSDDIDVFSASIPARWQEMLDCVGLLNFSEESTKIWWQKIMWAMRKFENETRVLLGRRGEEFTLEYEKMRLAKEGLNTDRNTVVWLSEFSDLYGYDISSISGSYERNDPKQRIMIETKTSNSDNPSHYRFFVSRNEWDTSLKNQERYYFYCWFGVQLSDTSPKKPPKIVPAKSLRNIIPSDQTISGRWISAQIVLDLRNF